MALNSTARRGVHAPALAQLCKLAGIGSHSQPSENAHRGDPKRTGQQATKQASGVLSTIRKLRAFMDDGAEHFSPECPPKVAADSHAAAPCGKGKPAYRSVLDGWDGTAQGEKRAAGEGERDGTTPPQPSQISAPAVGMRSELFDLQLVKAAELFAAALSQPSSPPNWRKAALAKLAALITQAPQSAAVPLAQAQQQMSNFLPQRPPVLGASITASQAGKLPGSSPQSNPINAYGALSATGEINGNAAFGQHHNNIVV